MKKAYTIEDDVIIIHRELTELDLFVKQFLDVLKKYADYLIVSGFVSIATGRTRGTEDVDILIPKMDQTTFQNLFNDLQKHEFWCYQGDHAETVYPYVRDLTSIRFAKKNEMFPNMEFISFNESKKLQFFEFQLPQKIKVKDFEFKIPPLEFEILYKEIILTGQKDLEDAKHLRTLFSDILKRERFKKFEEVIKSHG